MEVLHEFPNLAEMARDYLAIPATSVAVERCFSSAKNLTPPERASMVPQTACKMQELKQLIFFGGEELINYILSKIAPFLKIQVVK